MTYVECHGTGTLIGDPIELTALSSALRAGTEKKQYCAIGSLKTNMLVEDGREQVAGYHMPGDIIGLDGIGTDRHGTDAIALENTEVCVVPFDNVEHLARTRGIELVPIHEPNPPAGLVGDIVGVRIDGVNGESHRVLGTVYADGHPRILRVDDYNMDMIPEGHMVLIVNHDEPGVIGLVGTSFGDAKVNIASFALGRSAPGSDAIALLEIDGGMDDKTLAALRKLPHVKQASALRF